MIGDKRQIFRGRNNYWSLSWSQTLLSFFSFQGTFRAARKAFIEKFLFSLAMDCFSFDRQQKPPKIEIVDEIPPGQESDYLRARVRLLKGKSSTT